MPNLVASLPGYVWDKRLQGGRYRIVNANGSLGRVVSITQVADNLRTLHDRSATTFANLVGGYLSNKITLAVMAEVFMAELKNLHLATSALGAGGWNRMDAAAWGRAGRVLRNEYRFLSGFVADLRAGRLTEKQARNRARLYADNAYGAFWREFDRVNARGGQTQEHLIPVGDERVCQICTAAAGRGWVKIGTFLIPLHNVCRCQKDYR